MSLNETQRGYLKDVRSGEVNKEGLYETFFELDPKSYENKDFRELLFAIDAINVFQDHDWDRIFSRGLIENCDWIKDGVLAPSAFVEIGNYNITYGYGLCSVGLVIDLCEEASQLPGNAQSFKRRCVREYFNGIQPLNERAFYLAKRYIESKEELVLEDVELVVRIARETRGLNNSPLFNRFYSNCLRRFGRKEECGEKNTRWILDVLRQTEEIGDPEKTLIKMLIDDGVPLSKELLNNVDTSVARLSGLI